MCSSPILELERTGQWGIVTGYPLFASLFVVFAVVTRLRVLTFEKDGEAGWDEACVGCCEV
jgi:hypothetical protein